MQTLLVPIHFEADEDEEVILRRDMEGEERVFLSDQVLRDDPVAISPEPE